MAYLLGGLWLLYRKIISWYIPVAVLLGIFIPAGINFFLDANAASSPVFHLFSGASLCGAFFIATDPVSAGLVDRFRAQVIINTRCGKIG
jgi:electron transport complex protein RnfD